MKARLKWLLCTVLCIVLCILLYQQGDGEAWSLPKNAGVLFAATDNRNYNVFYGTGGDIDDAPESSYTVSYAGREEAAKEFNGGTTHITVTVPESTDTRTDIANVAPTITTTASSGKPTLKWSAVDGAVKYEIWRATSKTGTYSKYYTTTSTSYTNTSAVAGYTYYYKVKAIAANGKASNFSVVKSITCDCAQPVATISTTVSSGKPTLKWAAVDGATKYEIWRATSSTGTYSKYYTTTSTSYTNSSAVAGSTYYYKVKAICGKSSYGDSAFSAVKSITSDCAQPVVTISTTASSGKPTLKWAAVDGATKYEIWRATSKDGTYTKMYTTSNTSYTNSSAVAGKTYYYKVKALCDKSSYGDSAFSAIKSITCDCARPVVNITTSNGHPKLSWKAVDGATKYEVYRATSSNGTYTKLGTTSNLSYTNTSAKAGTTYYYKVIAVCGASSYGNSAYSTVVSIKAK